MERPTLSPHTKLFSHLVRLPGFSPSLHLVSTKGRHFDRSWTRCVAITRRWMRQRRNWALLLVAIECRRLWETKGLPEPAFRVLFSEAMKPE